MPSLETTNWILAVIAAATAAQFLMFFIGALWVARRVADLQDTISKTVTRFEVTHLPELTARATDLVEDLHKVAVRMDRVGQEVERATRIAQGTLHIAGAEVERATRGVRQAARVGAGVRAGLRELFARGTNGQERFEDEDAIARFEAGA